MNVLVIGGAGFIGSNVADYYLAEGHNVLIFDNLSRNGSEVNLGWLKDKYRNLTFVKGDVRTDTDKLNEVVKKQNYIFHFAAQVAVTTSVIDPREDFMINAYGTFNVLEAMRLYNKDAVLFYSSTNKVYGGMEDIEIVERNNRYEYKDFPYGIPENRILDFHSPYGCSKGTADQYVRDYARIYDLKTVVFRQSCIYGYRQFGVEDQGWVAWFTIASLFGKKITIYGDGKQVRDVLFIDDLVRAYDMAAKNENTYGKIYNIGGGPDNKMSLLELISYLERFFNKKIEYLFSDWRPGDQPVFVSDIRKAEKEFGWKPDISVQEGVEKLSKWVQENKELFEQEKMR